MSNPNFVKLDQKVSQHPLPAAEEIFTTLAGGILFTKLDLTHAYQQLELDEHAQEVLTIKTHRGFVSLYQTAIWGIISPSYVSSSVGTHSSGTEL